MREEERDMVRCRNCKVRSRREEVNRGLCRVCREWEEQEEEERKEAEEEELLKSGCVICGAQASMGELCMMCLRAY
jgi:hypothetical protein